MPKGKKPGPPKPEMVLLESFAPGEVVAWGWGRQKCLWG